MVGKLSLTLVRMLSASVCAYLTEDVVRPLGKTGENKSGHAGQKYSVFPWCHVTYDTKMELLYIPNRRGILALIVLSLVALHKLMKSIVKDEVKS